MLDLFELVGCGALRVRSLETRYGKIRYRCLVSDPDPELLLVGLHGFGIDEEQLQTLAPVQLADRCFQYVALRGFESFGSRRFGWFPIKIVEGRAEVELDAILFAVERLSATLTVLSQAAAVPPERVVLIGYSQGATLAIAQGLLAPHSHAATVAVAGEVIPAVLERMVRPVAGEHPWLIAHGTLDSAVPIARMRADVRTLRELGIDLTWHESRVPHVLSIQQVHVIKSWIERKLSQWIEFELADCQRLACRI